MWVVEYEFLRGKVNALSKPVLSEEVFIIGKELYDVFLRLLPLYLLILFFLRGA
jgi:hypothetical protein